MKKLMLPQKLSIINWQLAIWSQDFMLITVWITMWITSEKVVDIKSATREWRRFTELFACFQQLFHRFLMEKDINLVILHRN